MELAERFKRLYAGVVYDAMVFDLKIKPRTRPMLERLSGPKEPLAGPVFLCKGMRVECTEEINDNTRLEMLQHIPWGSVMCIDGVDNLSVAHFGDISALLARSGGAMGVVIDGYTRDLDCLRKLCFPVYARGARPHDAYGRWQILGCEITGEYVFADGDGVIDIPDGLAEQVCDLAEERCRNENAVRLAIQNGDDPKTLRERFGRW